MYCEKAFSPRRETQITCSPTCRKGVRRGCKSSKTARKETCTRCGSTYETTSGKNKSYCSNACKVRAWQVANPERQAKHRSRAKPLPRSSVFFNTCRVCSKEWTSQTSGLLCSMGCARTEGNRKSAARLEALHRAAARTTNCKTCGCVFSPLYGASHAGYCQPCAAEVSRRQKAIHREARKAKQRAATVEKVDPYKVFARDKWHCQECGVSTPRTLRGSYNDDAPELDHIQPLSKGGDHSYKNTQCLCRRCNLEKSDTWQPQGEESLQPA